MEAFFTPDGQKGYFAAYDEGDGRFIFFSRYNEANDVSNIYWVSARPIQTARFDLANRH